MYVLMGIAVFLEILLVMWCFVRMKYLPHTWFWRILFVILVLYSIYLVGDMASGCNPASSINIIVYGNPFPNVALEFKDGKWTDFVLPPGLMMVTILANRIFLASLIVIPVVFLFALDFGFRKLRENWGVMVQAGSDGKTSGQVRN